MRDVIGCENVCVSLFPVEYTFVRCGKRLTTI